MGIKKKYMYVFFTRPLRERRKILEENIKPIQHHVQLSEYQFVTSNKELRQIIAEVSHFFSLFFIIYY